MTPRQRRLYHERAERQCVMRVRFALRVRNYADAAYHAALALEQRAAAEAAGVEEVRAKIAKVQAVVRGTANSTPRRRLRT